MCRGPEVGDAWCANGMEAGVEQNELGRGVRSKPEESSGGCIKEDLGGNFI